MGALALRFTGMAAFLTFLRECIEEVYETDACDVTYDEDALEPEIAGAIEGDLRNFVSELNEGTKA